MELPASISFIRTEKERCRVCYTCVRECPAKAIRISDGQAEIIGARCLNCANCVKVCSRSAKQFLRHTDEVKALLDSGQKVAACLAPSFPAEFEDVPADRLASMVRALGFHAVHEVSFGADLVARQYVRLLADHPETRFISTTCPAVVAFVERYHPELVSWLAPIVSPMVALGRALRQLDKDIRIVFIGPCIAKKQEAANTDAGRVIDVVITFSELREMFGAAKITPGSVTPSDFDEPHGGLGMLFPVSRGMLQAADLPEDLVTGRVVTAQGRTGFADAIEEFAAGDLDAQLLEVLSCDGCIMGGGMTAKAHIFHRRTRVSQHVRQTTSRHSRERWQQQMNRFANLDLSRTFRANDQRVLFAKADELAPILARMGKFKPEDELNCGACGYDTCRQHAIAILKGLAESEMCLPYTIDQLRQAIKNLAISNEELARTQQALMHSEKLASMGQLAAGIAHELNNPLGVVLMYAHLLRDEAGKDPKLNEDVAMIAKHADRCKRIVAGLLHFARQNKVVRQPTDIRELVQASLKACPPPANITVQVRHELPHFMADLDQDQMLQAMTNLLSNAMAAMPSGGTLTLSTGESDGRIWLRVADTGIGIPPGNLSKLFEPFFTTKEIGKGTGLGLAVTYGIVKMHSGDILVESNSDPAKGPTGSTFTITMPRHGQVKPPESPLRNGDHDSTERSEDHPGRG